MDVVKAVRHYITKMVSEHEGMKVLLLDKNTTTIVSMVFSQSEVLQKEVYLIERVDVAQREPMNHMKCVAFLRPTQESIEALIAELKEPKYAQYDLYFSNTLTSSQLEQLAHADEHEVVRQVQEVYADYLAVDHNLVTLNIVGCLAPGRDSWRKPCLDRTTEGVVSMLLSLKKTPTIRFAGKSDVCKRLAADVAYIIEREAELFSFRQTHDTPPLLLLLDRRDDPVTPLLNQWTYQAMVHEVLGIHNNRVDLSGVPGASRDTKEVVISVDADDFYKKNIYLNFGEIGENIRTLVAEFQERTKSHENIESIADMKAFVESYPQFRQMSGTVSKHVTLVGELSRRVESGDLLNVSEIEQEISCQSNHSEVVQKIREQLSNPKVSAQNKTRLVLLYALRYERHSNSAVSEFVEHLFREGVPDRLRSLVSAIIKYAGSGAAQRQSDLFGTRGARGIFRQMTGGLKGVDNIYTQHTPLLAQTLDLLAKGRLKDASYPFLRGSPTPDRPQEVFVFMVGGVTYEEVKAVHDFNDANPAMRVVLGGTNIHNFKSFCEEIETFAGSTGAASGRGRYA
ncbi:vacuolar protein sorting 45A [Salpingoeca rosetta]|uniref:Vacuolar protein sorting-associated protein 45 n=1 Tax=Salpingoeca rosetta (strain ATCC 50818 / BSB-021) TaxID=946362 RepID=F2TXM2_SALR5|nr:vacuolar protein sorting 45A [Salpingoeca rosetta]EGD76131.1 vacuolar protein sorting 45A [Salpingoeca rosetta]|eukprot:XP_004998306.1 vacuolar protein sorting 45A [Salpingoeca rosetta]